MFRNYTKVAWRYLMKFKGFTFINVFGLTVGLLCCMLILTFIFNELSFEEGHLNKKNIYRVAFELNVGDRHDKVAAGMAPLGPMIKTEFPEVINTVRFERMRQEVIEYNDNRFLEKVLFFVDSTVFDIFTFPLLKGDPHEALKQPFTVVISERTAAKYFGQEEPIGKILRFQDRHDLLITGVLKDIPWQTQLRCDFMISYLTLEKIRGAANQNWFQFGSPYTYLLVRDGFRPDEFEKRLPEVLKKYIPATGPITIIPHLQPLTQIYLRSHMIGELEPSGQIGYIYLFAALAFLVMAIACINFMNLATARSAYRTKEIGMRKALGASRALLIVQFLGESVLMALLALVLGAILYELVIPVFESFLGTKISSGNGLGLWMIPGLIILAIIIGIFTGSYPALFLSRLEPLNATKSASHKGANPILRKILVLFQFAASVILIIATIIIFKQLYFVRNTNLGFDRDNVITVSMQDPLIASRSTILKNELQQIPAVVQVSTSSVVPGGGKRIAFNVEAEGVPSDENVVLQLISVDYDFLATLGAEIVTGRDFDRQFDSDEHAGIIINQAAVKRLGWAEPIGRKISYPDQRNYGQSIEGIVIGVVHDFTLYSLREKIEPIMIQVDPANVAYMLIRLRPGNLAGGLAEIQNCWRRNLPNVAFDYSFLDEQFERLHRGETRLGQILLAFSGLAILIACLGLFGLASYTTERRTKEIGIRKTIGASVIDLVVLLTKDFLVLVLSANIIAVPVAYFAMQKWLNGFAFRTNITVGVFIFAMLIAFLIALLTVGGQAARAATTNPVKSLRYE